MFKDHLTKSKVTYFQHFKWAFLAGFRLIYAGIASIIHGVAPSLFDGVPAKTVIDIYHRHLLNHPNGDYQEVIDSYREQDTDK
jgi:hypothetical protein